jgi:hypothetical protein
MLYRCSHFGIRPEKLERADGFEPSMIGFADQRLDPDLAILARRFWILDFGFWIGFLYETARFFLK